ncbi:MAG: DNA cytosine methyltransferase [Terriglobia bacterium]
MKANRDQPIAIDLFAGAGGMSLGFEQAGFDVVASIEYDPIHCSTHEFNFPGCAAICRSVADIDGKYIRSHSRVENRTVDVVFGGAPCQGFSMIGKRALDDPRNSLVYHFVRLVVELKASYFVFENVRGLTIGEHRRFLEEIIQEFRSNGYVVAEDYQVLNAAHHGVPQDRKRLFLLGSRKGFPLPRYPQATHSLPSGEATLFLERTPSVWDALKDLPEADDYDELLERDWVRANFKKATDYSAPLRGDVVGHDDLSTPREFERTLLTSSLRTVHTELSKSRFLATKQGETEPVSRFFKLDPNGICNTIRAGTASDRGAFTSPRPIHPFSPRCITVREAARLHSYPDWFRFHVTKWHGFRQIGNSVPPLLARAVASKVREAASDDLPGNGKRPIPLGDPALLSLNMSEAAAYYAVPSNTVPQRIRRDTGTHG